MPSYALEMVLNMRSKMRNFVSGLGKHVQKEYKALLLILDMGISRLVIYAQQMEDDKKMNKEEHLNWKAKLFGSDSYQSSHKG